MQPCLNYGVLLLALTDFLFLHSIFCMPLGILKNIVMDGDAEHKNVSNNNIAIVIFR